MGFYVKNQIRRNITILILLVKLGFTYEIKKSPEGTLKFSHKDRLTP